LDDKKGIDVTRRGLCAGLGVCAGLGLANNGLPRWLGGSTLDGLSYQETLALLNRSLSNEQRSHVVLPFDDPSLQVTNTVAIQKGPHIGTLFNAQQIQLARHLYKTMLSASGYNSFRNTVGLEGKFEGSSIKFYSDNEDVTASSNTVAMLNGGHFMLRQAQQRDQNHVFGGPISYGQQIGNNTFKVEGNAFKAHGDAVNELHAVLSSAQRAQAYQLEPPMELVTQVQGDAGEFTGLAFSQLSEAQLEVAEQLLATLFAAYPMQQQRDALSAIDNNGGLKALHLSLYKDFSFYQNGERLVDLSAKQVTAREDAYVQVWRIEGPACVIHFQGYPHVHAYINIVNTPERAAIGEALTHIESLQQGEAITSLLLTALRKQTGERFAYYPMPAAGRLPQGAVTTGSIYTIEPFNNHAVVVELKPEQMAPKLIESLILQGAELRPGVPTRLATVDYLLRDSRNLGEVDKLIAQGGSVRDSLIAKLKATPEIFFG